MPDKLGSAAHFLAAIDPNQGAVVLGQWIPRARFGLHLRLGQLATTAQAALHIGDYDGYSRAMAGYLHLCGVRPWRFRWWRFRWRFSGAELRSAFETLVDLNAVRWTLPFMQPGNGKRPDTAECDYPGRNWAWWVHKLASRYGWTTEAIFNLWPEEAEAYLQEIIISEYDEAEFSRSLSEVAYVYDKGAQKSFYRPLARPGWMVPQPPERVVRVRRDVLPWGVVKISELPN